MTRVTLVSYDDEPPLGGQGVEVRGMRSALTARGHAVTTVAGHGVHGYAFRRVTGRAPLDFSIHVNRHPHVIRDTRPEVVHALGGPGGVLLLRQLDVPLVYTANHTYRMAHPRGSLRGLLSPLEARAYRRAAAVLAISSTTADAVRGLGIPAHRVEVLSPGVDVPPALPQGRDGGRLLFVGRWEEEKGVLEAVAVMRAVMASHAGASAVVLGAGRLQERVRALAAGASGIDVAGHVDETRLAAEYARAAVVLMPSRYEGLGLVALEAQAHGAVVAGYDVEGLRDAVAHPQLLVRRGERARLTDLCLRLLDDQPWREALAAQARTWVSARHSWDAVGRRLGEVYAAVLQAS